MIIAGRAAPASSGDTAAYTPLPVIGVPFSTKDEGLIRCIDRADAAASPGHRRDQRGGTQNLEYKCRHGPALQKKVLASRNTRERLARKNKNRRVNRPVHTFRQSGRT